MNVHTFDSTGEAYDATQCDENVKKGDLLVIPSENVVGIADTWPIAITKECGALHRITDGTDKGLVDWFVELGLVTRALRMGSPNRRGARQ